jgi:hypothetical protein
MDDFVAAVKEKRGRYFESEINSPSVHFFPPPTIIDCNSLSFLLWIKNRESEGTRGVVLFKKPHELFKNRKIHKIVFC